MFDLLLTGERIVDGTGNPWVRADLGVRGDRIVAVGALMRQGRVVGVHRILPEASRR